MKKKIKTEAVAVRRPTGIPVCPLHNEGMKFDQVTNMWACTVTSCTQKAFPKVDMGKYEKPILVDGTLEVVLVDDPDGAKRPKFLLRNKDGGNIMVDITDHITDVTVENDDYDIVDGTGHRTSIAGPAELTITLRFSDYMDARRRQR